jgi:hypothetical protein
MPTEHEHAENLKRERALYREAGESFKKTAAGSPAMAPIRAVQLGKKMRRAAKEGQQSSWLIAFALAIACDCADFIPVAGWIITLFFRPTLFIFLWGRGTWKIKLVCYTLVFLDFIPVISMIPLSTISVAYAYAKSIKKIKEVKAQLKTATQNA